MKTRHLGLTATFATALAALTVTAAPAPVDAAAGWDRCPRNSFCAFTGPNGSGVMATYRRGDSDLGDAFGPQGMNNNIESVWNRINDCGTSFFAPFCNVTLFGQPSCEGDSTYIVPQPGPAGRRNLSAAWQNRASAIWSLRIILDC